MGIIKELIRPQFLILMLPLSITGMVIKYRTKVSNRLIAFILLVTSIILCSILGFITSTMTGWHRVVDALLYCGLCHGIVIASVPVLGWDTVYGVFKYGVIQKKKKELKNG